MQDYVPKPPPPPLIMPVGSGVVLVGPEKENINEIYILVFEFFKTFQNKC